MPKPFPLEFRRDVIAVARSSGASRAEVARNFGNSASCLTRWLDIADREDAAAGRRASPGSSTAIPPVEGPEAEMRELRRRNKQLEQENEILRRATAYFARDAVP